MSEEDKTSIPLLSVCLITYNHAPYIRQAIEGVLMQKTTFNFDLIIADDCSTDGTTNIVLEYKEKYPRRIQLILQGSNVGAQRNWIDLMNSAHTEFVAYLEGDDYWTVHDKLQRQVEFLNANISFSFTYHAFDLLNQSQRSIDTQYLKTKNECPPGNVCNLQYYVRNRPVKSLSVVYRRKAVPVSFWKMVFDRPPVPTSGDIPLFIMLLISGNGFFFSDVMGVYRVHDDGITKKDRYTNDVLQISMAKLLPFASLKSRKIIMSELTNYLKERLVANDFSMVFFTVKALLIHKLCFLKHVRFRF